MAAKQYGYQKERKGEGYSIWTLGLSGSRQDIIGYARTARDAQRKINKLHAADEAASTPSSTRHHSTKKSLVAPKSQRAMYDEVSRKSAEVNETFLEMLPTMRRRELEKLIEKRPALWGRFAGYLTSGHVFADDPSTETRHHATKKSPAQLQREIEEVLGRPATDADPEKWRVDPSQIRVGQRFDYFGKVFEIVTIGRDKARTITIARRVGDAFGKEGLIDHRSFPLRNFYQQHLRPLHESAHSRRRVLR